MGTDSTAPTTEVRSLDGVFALLQKSQVAAVYTQFRDEPTTVPALLQTLDVGKTAAYDYCEMLRSAGLISQIDTDGRSAVYRANDFEITLRIGDEEVTVTPALVRLLAARTETDQLEQFIDQYGIATLATFLELATQYAAGEMTHRAIASRLDIPRGMAYDTLEVVLSTLEMAPESDHAAPGDRSDAEVAALIDEARDSASE